MNYGYEGIGLFFTFLEKIANQEKPVNTKVLKAQLKVGKKLEKVWNFLEGIELISSNNGESFSEQLLNYAQSYMIKKEKNKKRITEWRDKQQDTNNVTCYESVRNARKVKVSKVKVEKDIEKDLPLPADKTFHLHSNFANEQEFFNYVNTHKNMGRRFQMLMERFQLKRNGSNIYYYDKKEAMCNDTIRKRLLRSMDEKQAQEKFVNILTFMKADEYWSTKITFASIASGFNSILEKI